MPDTSPIVHRAKQRKQLAMQTGTIVSLTTVRHPPAEFPAAARQLALIELEDTTSVIAPVDQMHESLSIGQTVQPHMRFSRVNAQGLRVYEVVYSPVVETPEIVADFAGYIVALTGPAGVGRTTVAAMLQKALGDYAVIVPLVTYRRGTSLKYREVLSKHEFTSGVESGAIVSNDGMHGYRLADLDAVRKAGKLPIVIAEEDLIKLVAEHYGRRSVLSFGLLPPGKSKRAMLSHLLHRLRSCERYGESVVKEHLASAEQILEQVKRRKKFFNQVIVNENIDDVVELLVQYVGKYAS